MIPEYQRQLPLTSAHEDVEREVRRRAVLSVCCLATDAEDADNLLEALGLRPNEGRRRATCESLDR